MEQYEYISKEKCKLLDINILKQLNDTINVYFKGNTIIGSNEINTDDYYKIQYLPLFIGKNKLLIDAECGFFFDIKKRLQNSNKFHYSINRKCYNAYGTLTSSEFYYFISSVLNVIYIINIFNPYQWAGIESFLYSKSDILNIWEHDIWLDDISEHIYDDIVFPLLKKEDN